ncbi:MAG: diphthine--ammonia ligase [Fusobacteriaceae bacterium]
MDNFRGKKFVASLSGGKDSLLALYKMKMAGAIPVAIITIANPKTKDSYFHEIPKNYFEALAKELSVKLFFDCYEGDDYQKGFADFLNESKKVGAEFVVFGDIDIEEHKLWGEGVAEIANMEAVYPLWQNDRKSIVDDCIKNNIRAFIKTVDNKFLDNSFLGRDLDLSCVKDLISKGVDACGENGEYHTIVYDSPLFQNALPIKKSDIKTINGYSFMTVSL